MTPPRWLNHSQSHTMLLVIQDRQRAAALYDDELLSETEYSHPGIRFETEPDAATEWPVAEVPDDELAERLTERYPSVIPLSDAPEAPADEDIPDDRDAVADTESAESDDGPGEGDDTPDEPPARDDDDSPPSGDAEPESADVPPTDGDGTLSGGPQPPDGG